MACLLSAHGLPSALSMMRGMPLALTFPIDTADHGGVIQSGPLRDGHEWIWNDAVELQLGLLATG